MRAVIIGAFVAFVLSILGTPIAIRAFTQLKADQPIRSEGPQTHLGKKGTPTMGGVVFIVATVLAYVVGHLSLGLLPAEQIRASGPTTTGVVILGLFICTGLLGFIDDYLKVRKRNSLGLSMKTKLIGQAAIGVVFGVIAFYNAVNLTDGLDGLATGVSVMVIGTYAAIAFWQYRHWSADENYRGIYEYVVRDPLEIALIAAAAAAACFGFLWWNASPARIFMGDTGSMALGSLIAGLALATKTVLLLPVIGLLFVIITVTWIMQIGSYRLTGKRIFRMVPLQHHFELAGWSEVNIVIRFWIIAGLGVAIGIGLFYADFLRVVSGG